MLVRLLYASRAIDTSPDAIEMILSQSRQHNPECGITGILNFAPIVLDVPEDVMVNNVNLAIELENLSYFIQE